MVGLIERVGKVTEVTLRRELQKAEKRFAFAAAISLTKTAKIAQKNVISEMQRVFDRPTPWTLRGTYIVPAKPNRQETKVAFKDDSALPALGQKGGTAAANYIKWQVEGGQRQQTGIERKLAALGIISRNEFVVPGQGTRLNRYGNIARSRLSKILADIQGSNIGFAQGFGQATTTVGKKKYFYNPNSRPRAIYERYGRGGRRARPVLFIIKQPTYKPRLNFRKIVVDTFERHLDDEFDKQWDFK